ncbi:antigen-presenting glycoprotein CD1d-like [Mantella aurantiaca]
MEMEDIQLAATYNKPVLVFKQSWAKGDIGDDHWSLFNVFLNKYFSTFKRYLFRIHKELNVTGVSSVQCLTGCPSFLEDPEDFTYKVAINNEYQLHLNFTRKVWVAEPDPFAQVVQKILQDDHETMNNLVVHVTNLCMQLADLFSKTGKEVFSRKIQPQVHITSHSDRSETEILCMVTGFYPKPINVSLWKENYMEDVLSTETLPNEDETYQITVSKIVNFLDLQNVNCRVEHSSFQEPLIVYLGE